MPLNFTESNKNIVNSHVYVAQSKMLLDPFLKGWLKKKRTIDPAFLKKKINATWRQLVACATPARWRPHGDQTDLNSRQLCRGHMEIKRTSTPGHMEIKRAGVPMFDAYSTAHPSPVG
jgi:hypothetical protein